jgi:predicted transcriptional regulator
LTTQLQLAEPRCVIASKMSKLKHDNSLSVTNRTKRGRLEIFAEILLFCDQRKAKTNIMYRTNLNYAQLQSHLKLLTSQGLLSMETEKYVTTEKGFHYIELFLELHDILRDEAF